MTGSWQAEAVLVAVCLGAIVLLVRRGRARARWVAAALAMLAVAATLGGLLFAGIAPAVGPAHDMASRLFATLGFAIVAVVLVGGSVRHSRWAGPAATAVLASIGLVVPLAPVVAVAHGVAWWRSGARFRQAIALAAIVAVIAGQVIVPAGAARLDTLHVTLALWVASLAFALVKT